jgi:hypothetical protein
MSDYIQYLCDEFLLRLTDSEKKSLINFLVKHLRNDNKIKLKELPASKAIIVILNFLYEQKLIDFKNSDVLINAFESINRNDFAIKIAQNDLACSNPNNSNNNNSNKTTVNINNHVIELNFKPYHFQLKLAQNGCDRLNNIIVVRTGSGKTLISAIICKYWQTVNKSRPIKVAFIVPTRYLASQQCSVFEKAFDKECLQEVGEKANEKKINEYFKTKSILFLTAQKLINTLNEDYFKLSDFDILIFDEVHHCDLDHPYNKIMLIYLNEKLKNSKLPLIIGLTASLGIGTGKLNPLLYLISLMANLECKHISWVFDQNDLDDLNKNIPSSLDDILCLVSPDTNLINSEKEIISSILKIAKLCAIDLNNSTERIGQPDFDSYISDKRLSILASQRSK